MRPLGRYGTDVWNKDSAYPLLNKVPVIGTTADYFPSAMGRTAKKLYESGKITIGQAMSVWKYDYAAAGQAFSGTCCL